MSSVVVDSITIGIPFSLSLANMAGKNIDATSCASNFKRTFEVPNRSFVMELATDSLCSFNSELLSNDAYWMDRVHTDSESTDLESWPLGPPSKTDLCQQPESPENGISVEGVSREEEWAMSEWVSYDLPYDESLESRRRNASEYGFGSGSGPWRRSSRSRDYSNAFHPCRKDSLEKGNSLKLRTSQVSSKASTRCSVESRTNSTPWPTTGHAAISRPTMNSSLSLSTSAQMWHKRAVSSMEKSSELDFWNNYDAFKDIGVSKSHMDRSKRHKKRFLLKMLGCFCVQAHKRNGIYL